MPRMKNKKLAWPFSFFFIVSAAAAVYHPYLVLYFQSLSLSGTQIGLLVGVAPLVMMVSLPLITGIADRTNKHSFIMSLSLLVVVLGLILYPTFKTFILLFSLIVLLSIFLSPVFPLANNATMIMLGERKELFGRIRMGGTIGFSIAAAIAGVLVENYGLKIAFWSAAVLYILAFFVNQKLVHQEGTAENVPNQGRVKDLLKNPRFFILMLIGFAGGISYASNNTYLFPYLKELGAEESIMGLALTIGTIAEIPVLFFVSRFIKRFNAYAVLIFSMVMTSLRFLLLVIAANPAFVLGIQVLHGFTHPLLSVAGVTYADEQAPVGFKATAQGLFNAAMGGIGAAFGGFVGGLIFDRMGGRGVYLAFCIFVLLILGLVGLLPRILPSRREPKSLTESG